MSKGFSINDILGSGAKTAAPAGQKMQVVMLPAADIEPNPENNIYEIGDVSMLKADIAERGLRSPLEVLPAQNGKYMLLAGHRRWTACCALTAEGVTGFEVLPCVIHQSQGADDDLIALITSNATARELTDGERLRQYRALKQALERKKAAGALDGRIRDEMSRITGDGTGTLGRLNAIANNCVPEVLAMVERGEITMTRAYECSKLYKVQQVEYAKIKYASMPPITDMARRAAIKYLVECGLADQLKKLDYVRKSEWNYDDHGLDVRKMEPVTLDLTEGETDALLRITPADGRGARVQMRDPADTDEVLAESLLYPRDFFGAARKAYINKDDLAAYKAEEKSKRDQERARQDEAGKWQALARQELEAFDSWPLVTRMKDLGLTIREREMADGGRLVIAVDDLARWPGHVDGFPYRECFAVRLGPNGERAGRDGDVNALEGYKRWYSTGAAIENYISGDIKRAAREAKKK
jgi:ParB-like chromosome segregation protein Spo0J